MTVLAAYLEEVRHIKIEVNSIGLKKSFNLKHLTLGGRYVKN
jgi:hypothetical protein